PDSAEYGTRHAERAEKLDWILARADAVLVSTPPLEDYAKRIARDVRRLPSVFAEIAERPSAWHEPPVIGWVGGPENQRYLRVIEPVLMRLQREHPSLEVWIVTRELMNPAPVYRHKFWPWSLEAEQTIIPRFTAAVAPLDEDEWCRAKMNFKALVCTSRGVPCVTSPVGFPLSEFEENRSALTARTEDDWYRHLKTLIADPTRRNEIANEGLRVMRERFTAAARVGEFATALRGR
ncbi:MAG: glycosyltransferase, partial [bacterium]|nr:glycosyltransferase [bacterium]